MLVPIYPSSSRIAALNSAVLCTPGSTIADLVLPCTTLVGDRHFQQHLRLVIVSIQPGKFLELSDRNALNTLLTVLCAN